MVRNNRKVRTGRVISNKMDKTVVVAIEWRQQHPVYKKSVRKISKLHAHDPENRLVTLLTLWKLDLYPRPKGGGSLT